MVTCSCSGTYCITYQISPSLFFIFLLFLFLYKNMHAKINTHTGCILHKIFTHRKSFICMIKKTFGKSLLLPTNIIIAKKLNSFNDSVADEHLWKYCNYVSLNTPAQGPTVQILSNCGHIYTCILMRHNKLWTILCWSVLLQVTHLHMCPGLQHIELGQRSPSWDGAWGVSLPACSYSNLT